PPTPPFPYTTLFRSVLSIAAASFGFAPAGRAADQKKAAADDTVTITLDVAMDAASARASRPDWSITGPLRGDSFVSGGLVYLGRSEEHTSELQSRFD